jgi:hypothetical protein
MSECYWLFGSKPSKQEKESIVCHKIVVNLGFFCNLTMLDICVCQSYNELRPSPYTFLSINTTSPP